MLFVRLVEESQASSAQIFYVTPSDNEAHTLAQNPLSPWSMGALLKW